MFARVAMVVGGAGMGVRMCMLMAMGMAVRVVVRMRVVAAHGRLPNERAGGAAGRPDDEYLGDWREPVQAAKIPRRPRFFP